MAITAQQTACGIAGSVTNGPPIDVLVEKQRTLPTPVVQSPLRECERKVTVSNIVHGAQVTLLRSAGPNLQALLRPRLAVDGREPAARPR